MLDPIILIRYIDLNLWWELCCFRQHFLQWIESWFGARFGDLVFTQLLFMTVPENSRTLEQLWNRSINRFPLIRALDMPFAQTWQRLWEWTPAQPTDSSLWQNPVTDVFPCEGERCAFAANAYSLPSVLGRRPIALASELSWAGRCFEHSLNCC
jgi:hypothetical protein